MQNHVTPVLGFVALVLIPCFLFLEPASAFYVLLAVIVPAWLLILFLAARNLQDTRSVASLFRDFEYQVDRVRQNVRHEPQAVDQGVQAAFDQLHADVASLLRRRRIRMAQVKREVQRFHAPDKPLGVRWRPPTLREMGYMVAAAETYSPDTAVLALYKYSGEERNHRGAVADTYTILKEGASPAFSAAFKAKIQSSLLVALAPREAAVAEAHAAPATAMPAAADNTGGAADADHNVGYILSLLGPVTLPSARVWEASLRAIARYPADAAQALPADMVWSNLRSVLTAPMLHHGDRLAAASAAIRQAPHLLLCAAAGREPCQSAEDGTDARCSALAALAEMLAQNDDEASRAGLANAARVVVSSIRALEPVPAQQPLVNGGCAYVEARGAESDAGLLKRIAQLLAPAPPSTDEHRVLVVSHLTRNAFEQRLRGYAALSPGIDDQGVIEALLEGVQSNALALHTVTGLRALKAQDLLNAQRGPYTILSCDPTRVDVEGLECGMQYLLWTAAGRALKVDPHTLLYLRPAAQQIRDYT